jgi:hypothetical protein
MHITTPSNGAVTVNAWTYAAGYSFYGHYDLTIYIAVFGGTLIYHSNTQTWTHTDNAWWRNYAAVIGKWCVTGWKLYNGHYYNIGEPCETVSLPSTAAAFQGLAWASCGWRASLARL